MNVNSDKNVTKINARDDDRGRAPGAGFSRRQALARLGIGVSIAYAAPAVLTLSRASANSGPSGPSAASGPSAPSEPSGETTLLMIFP